MKEKENTREAIILAGGLSKRMQPSFGPKWLTNIATTTIAQHQLTWLRKNNISRVYVTMSRRFLPIELGPTAIPVEFISEDHPIGDEGGLKKALEHILTDVALVLNCDILTDLNMSPEWSIPLLTLVHPRSPWGVFHESSRPQEDLNLFSFVEKPLLPIWVSSGIYLFPKTIKEELVSSGEIARNIIPKLLREKRLNILKYEGKWKAIETIKDAEEVDEEFLSL